MQPVRRRKRWPLSARSFSRRRLGGTSQPESGPASPRSAWPELYYAACVTEEARELDYPDMTGELVAGKYRVENLLGTGGMGTVWLGHHEALGTKVAVKFIKPQFSVAPDARRRFEIEARAA